LTEFATELRHYCRNPRCRSKLPAPIANPREAFCARGCHGSFYRKRCLVCEASMERKTERQLICGKRKCRNALKGGEIPGRYHTPARVVSIMKTPDFIEPKVAPKTDRGVDWAIAVNRARIRAPRRVLDVVFGRIPVADPAKIRGVVVV
jgi:hypothetical protein